MTNSIIAHQIGTLTIGQRGNDGYINATRLTQAYREQTGKRRDVNDWLRTKRTQEMIEHLASNTGIPVNQIYQVFQGSPDNGGGTWLHPKLATRFAIWLSDDFGLMVENWVETWMTQPQIEPQAVLPQTYKEALKALLAEIEAKELLEAEKSILEQENRLLSEAVDELFDYSSIIRIAKYNEVSEASFNWRLLKAASDKLSVEIKKVPCPRFVSKNLYSHNAWRLAYPEYRLPETTTLIIKH
jgi:hypothetical protein